MAFATANVRRSVFGDMNITAGDWTASEGDAAGTIGVEGGRVYMANFTSQDSSGNIQIAPCRVSVSTSGNVTTVTVYHQETVTTGRFLIIHK
jgi:hypothetical protein